MTDDPPAHTAFGQTVRAVLAGGCPLSRLEETLVADGRDRDEAAAAWLYAWSYDAMHPPDADLEIRLTHGAMEFTR